MLRGHTIKSLSRNEARTVLHYWCRTRKVMHRRYYPLFWYSSDYGSYWPTTEMFELTRGH